MLPQSLISDYSKTKIERVIKKAIENKPTKCSNIRIIDKTVYNLEKRMYERNIFARYNTKQGQNDLQIEKVGDWATTDPANYILYQMGEYHPFSTKNFTDIQSCYESHLDSGLINEPIKGITSPRWKIQEVCEEIIEKSIDNVTFTLFFDKNELKANRFDSTDYRHYWDDVKIKQYYCSKIMIEYGGKIHITRGGFYSQYISWINKCVNALKKHNLNSTVKITDKDYEKWCKFHNWNDMEFEDSRFKL